MTKEFHDIYEAGKMGNLEIHFPRQGKHKEFAKEY